MGSFFKKICVCLVLFTSFDIFASNIAQVSLAISTSVTGTNFNIVATMVGQSYTLNSKIVSSTNPNPSSKSSAIYVPTGASMGVVVNQVGVLRNQPPCPPCYTTTTYTPISCNGTAPSTITSNGTLTATITGSAAPYSCTLSFQ